MCSFIEALSSKYGLHPVDLNTDCPVIEGAGMGASIVWFVFALLNRKYLLNRSCTIREADFPNSRLRRLSRLSVADELHPCTPKILIGWPTYPPPGPGESILCARGHSFLTSSFLSLVASSESEICKYSNSSIIVFALLLVKACL